MRSSRGPRFLGLRVLAWRLRRVALAAGVVGLALLVARALAPPPPPTVPVVVAARALEAGAVLEERDLAVRRLPSRLAPDGAPRLPDDLVGEALAVPAPAGLPLVDAVLAGPRFAVEQPPGSVVVPVHLADAATVGVLRPGDRLDLVATGGWSGEAGAGPPAVLARDALLVEMPETGSDTWDPGSGVPPPVLVAVSPDEGRALAATAAAGAVVGAVLVG